jgi:hypothetical protein
VLNGFFQILYKLQTTFELVEQLGFVFPVEKDFDVVHRVGKFLWFKLALAHEALVA